MNNILALAVPGFLLMIGVELLVARLKRRSVYRFDDSVADLSCGLGDQVLKALTGGLIALPYVWIYEHARLFELSTAMAWLIGMVGIDFFYYWYHRFSHRTAFGWAAHGVHHQSEDYNLAVALRQSWFAGLYSWVFYLPLAWVGVPFEIYAAGWSLNLLYQFILHSRLVGRLGPLEWLLNTPSHHRVHHGCEPQYLDKNYAGVLMCWDRWFGTFEPEGAEPSYGVLHPIRTWNPAWANVGPYVELVRRSMRTPRLWDKVQLWFRPPGWTPETGELNPPVGPGRGYAPKGSLRMRLYVAAMYVPLIPAIVALMASKPHPWSWMETLWYGLLALYVAVSATTLGGLLDGARWSRPAEIARVLGSVLVFGGLALAS